MAPNQMSDDEPHAVLMGLKFKADMPRPLGAYCTSRRAVQAFAPHIQR
jgi:hypothetical protein